MDEDADDRSVVSFIFLTETEKLLGCGREGGGGGGGGKKNRPVSGSLRGTRVTPD